MGSGAAIFQKIPVLRADFYDNLPSRRKRWEGYEKIVTTIFELGDGDVRQFHRTLNGLSPRFMP